MKTIDSNEDAIEQLTTALDSGWSLRKSGVYSRLLKFKEPLRVSNRADIVLALCLYDGPIGRRVLPGEHMDDLSGDGLMLRIRVKPARRYLASPPATLKTTAATYTHTLFGSHVEGAA